MSHIAGKLLVFNLLLHHLIPGFAETQPNNTSIETDEAFELCDVETSDDDNAIEMDCFGRSLTRIPKFTLYRNFTDLNLAYNKITAIEEGDFKGLTNVTRLNMGWNKVSRIGPRVFSGLSSVQLIILDKNQLTVIEPGAFEGLPTLTELVLSSNKLTRLSADMFRGLYSLESLELRRNEISIIDKGCFNDMPNIKSIESNKLTEVQTGIFSGISSLILLRLQHNLITTVHPDAFDGLTSLKDLYLSHNRLSNLPPGCFRGLTSLGELEVSYNQLTILLNGVFSGLNQTVHIDLRFNNIEEIESEVFSGIHPNLTFYSDDWRVCCIAITSGAECHQLDEGGMSFYFLRTEQSFEFDTPFSSCKDLMHNESLRLFIWILGIFAAGFNAGVIAWRLLSRYKSRSRLASESQRKSALLTLCLAFGDLCMGAFLLIVGIADHTYRGYYILQDEKWRSSFWCSFAGFLSAFSSEFSVFILTLITVDRYLAVMYPLSTPFLNRIRTYIIVAVLFLVAVILAAVPLMTSSLPGFYNQTGVCLALPLSITTSNSTNTSDFSAMETRETASWMYSFSIFIGLNTISIIIILFCYAQMLYEVIKSKYETTNTASKTETRMGHRIMLIVGTDMACWLPISLLGLISASGYELPPTVYAWIAVFVLPINSAINPLIYTYYTRPFQRAATKKWRRHVMIPSLLLLEPNSRVSKKEEATETKFSETTSTQLS